MAFPVMTWGGGVASEHGDFSRGLLSPQKEPEEHYRKPSQDMTITSQKPFFLWNQMSQPVLILQPRSLSSPSARKR